MSVAFLPQRWRGWRARSRRECTRLTRSTRFVRTAMSGLSSGTISCGGEAGRFLRTGEGDLKKDRMVPFFLFFFFFCGVAFVACTGATTSVISSSVEGGEEREESESAMFVVAPFVAVVMVACRAGKCSRQRRSLKVGLGTYEVILFRYHRHKGLIDAL